MKLYFSKGACSLAVRIVLHEIGVSCEYEAVNLATKQTESGADFFQVNPKGAVPVLVTDDNETLTENAAIQQYLADKYHAANLLPAVDEFSRYRVLEWLNFVSTDLHKGFGPLFDPKLPAEIKDTFVKPLLKNKFDYVDHHLQQHKYLMGEQFTLADAYLFVITSWLAHFAMDINQWPALARYFAELKQRPSVHQSLQDEGLPVH